MPCLAAGRFVIIAAVAVATAVPASAAAGHRRHRHFRAAERAAQPSQPPSDDLYRRRGYGIGGAFFGADTALAGTCADLRFAEPDSCGRGYGIYGNGLGTRFGR